MRKGKQGTSICLGLRELKDDYIEKKEELGSGNRSHKLIHSQLVILRKVPAIKERVRILRMYFQISHALY